MQNTITEIKNSLEAAHSRIQEAEEWISEVEDRLVEITDFQNRKEKKDWKQTKSLRELWDNGKHTNIRIIGVPEGGEREKGTEKNIPRDNSRKLPSHGEGTTHSNPGSTTSTTENKPKEEHPETHTNQTDQNERQRENLESS